MAVLTGGRAVLLTCRDEQLDSLLALRRIAAHLGDLPRLGREDARRPEARRPGAALVCDDEAATAHLVRLGVPVLHVSSAPFTAAGPPGALARAHWPDWLDRPPGVRPTGLLAPTRLTRNRDRRGALLLLSLWGVPVAEAESFTADRLPALIDEAVRRTGCCTVVCDTALDLVRAAAAGRPGASVARAADTNVDARHAESELLLASPTMAALALARARRAPLSFLPPLGPAQRALAGQLARLVPIPTLDQTGLTAPPPPTPPAGPTAPADLVSPADLVNPVGRTSSTAPAGPTAPATSTTPAAPAGPAHPVDPAVWLPPSPEVQWAPLGPELDDLRGAQAVARTVRQLLLAPL